MQAGKLSPSALQQSVFSQLRQRRPEVLVTASLGEDSAALDLAGNLVVVSTDPITGAAANAGWLAVHVSCNDVASNGAEPVAILLTLLLPVGASEQDVQQIVSDAERAAAEVQAQIVGGHTEFTAAVNQPVISCTVIGQVPHGRLATSGQIVPGDALVISKYVGLEGTAIIAADYPELVRPVLGDDLLLAAQALSRQISIVSEARIASELGVKAMHDATEGGVLGAAYEMAAAAKLGFQLQRARLPLHPATAALTAHFGLDALRLISSGTLLMASSQPEQLVSRLSAAGIPAAVIGQFTSETGHWLHDEGGQIIPIAPPESDELWRFLALFAHRTT